VHLGRANPLPVSTPLGTAADKLPFFYRKIWNK